MVPQRSDERAFTLVELSVALVLTLIVAGLAYEMYAFTHRMALQWRREVRLDNGAHRIARQLTEDVRRARFASVGPAGGILLVGTSHDSVRYRWEDATLLREDVPMHPAALGVKRAKCEVRLSGGRFRVQCAVDLVDAGHNVASSQTLKLKTDVVTRQPAPWPSVSH